MGVTPWRDLPPGSPERVLRDVAGGELPRSADVEPLGDVDLGSTLVGLATTEGLLGPLVACRADAGLRLSDEATDELVARHERAMHWCLTIERRLLDVDAWFAAAGGVRYLVIKGPAVAHLDEDDPSLRSFADLDLLIHGDDMDRALEVLADHGAERRIPERRPGFDRRFVKGVGTRCADGVEIDVHRTLCGGAHGFRIPLEDLFARAVPFDVAGTTFLAPTLAHRALHACYHAVVGSPVPPLRTLRDIAGYLRRPDLPVDDLVAEARRWRGEAVLAAGVTATLDAFDLDHDVPAWRRWVDGVAVPPTETRLIEMAQDQSTGVVDWSAVGELAPLDRIRYVWAVAVPSRATLADRGETHRSRLLGGGRRRLSGRGRSLRRRGTR